MEGNPNNSNYLFDPDGNNDARLNQFNRDHNVDGQEKTNKQKFEEFMNNNVLPFQWEEDLIVSDEDSDDTYNFDLSDSDFSGSYYSRDSSHLDIPQRTRQNYSLDNFDSIHSDENNFWELSDDFSDDMISYESNQNLDYENDSYNNEVYVNQSMGQFNDLTGVANDSMAQRNDISFGNSFDDTYPSTHAFEKQQLIPPNGTYVIDIEQWNQINLQLSRHFQLLVQVFLLTKKLDTHEQVIHGLSHLLKEFYDTYHIFNLGFRIHGVEYIKSLLESEAMLSQSNFDLELSKFANVFSPKLRIELDYKSNKTPKKWTPAEDKLLAIGFNRYQKDWESIQSSLLLTKEIKSIKSRFKNKTSKKSRDNPIKHVYLQATAPLTPYEVMMLQKGIRMYGSNFDMIATMMPPRKPYWLKKFWKKMNNRTKRNTAKMISRKRDEDSMDEMSEQSDTSDFSSGSENMKRPKFKDS